MFYFVLKTAFLFSFILFWRLCCCLCFEGCVLFCFSLFWKLCVVLFPFVLKVVFCCFSFFWRLCVAVSLSSEGCMLFFLPLFWRLCAALVSFFLKVVVNFYFILKDVLKVIILFSLFCSVVRLSIITLLNLIQINITCITFIKTPFVLLGWDDCWTIGSQERPLFSPGCFKGDYELGKCESRGIYFSCISSHLTQKAITYQQCIESLILHTWNKRQLIAKQNIESCISPTGM